MSRLIALGAACATFLVAAVPASAAPPVVASGPSPFSLCTADNPAAQQQFSTLYPNAEPEPRSDINPTNPLNLVGMYQQDRWDNGGARGLVSSWTKDGGATWHPVVIPGITKCSGGIYDRASDPWVSFAPNGDLYAISLTFDAFDTHNAIIVNKSTNGGESWGPPLEITADDTNGLDKESITADPYDASRVYAVWDRFLSPPGINASDQGKIHARSYVEQTWFSRTTNGGASWEPARVAFNPGTQAGTIGNIIVVLPNATHDLIDGFILFAEHKSKIHGTQIAVVRSTDHGITWSKKPIIVAQTDPSFLEPFDPDTGEPIRGGELPDFAVDPRSGNLYAVWEDDTATPGIDAIMYSQSTDGGFTWSPAVKINQTPTTIPAGNQQAFTPTVKVAANGTVGVTYYDLRSNTPAPGLPTDYWLVRCSSACTSPSSWSETHVAGPFDEEQAAFAGGYFLGDYEGLTTSGNVFQPFFVQAVSRAAGNPSDVYFTTVP